MGKVVSDFKCNGAWVKSYVEEGLPYATKMYSIWNKMKCRCKVGGAHQRNNPSYIGCTMSENFKDFQYFADWYSNQKGYGEYGYHLDKDLLFTGNMLYSEHTCTLVPPALNNFLVRSKKRQGAYPVGVSFDKSILQYSSDIRIDGKSTCLGKFSTAEEAHDVYVVAKVNEARRWAFRLSTGEFSASQLLIDALYEWKFKESEGATLRDHCIHNDECRN